jgi:HEAT repeat protein
VQEAEFGMTRSLSFVTLFGTVMLGFSQPPRSPEITFLQIETTASASRDPAWNTLNKGLHDSDPEHRIHAVVAVGTIGPTPETVKLLETVLRDDKSTLVRQSAAVTLGDIKARSAIPSLETALDDNPEVSFAAAKSLESMGSTSGRWVLEEVLQGERTDKPGAVHGAVRKAKQKLHNPTQLALMGVKEATGQFLGPASMGISIGQIALKDGGATGRTAAVTALSKDPDPYIVTLFEWALADKSWAVRAAVVRALGERGNRDTIPKLLPLLTDDRDLVRSLAAASVIRLSQTGSPEESVTH